jgi:type IV pilus assembly protein PilA
MQIVQSKNQKGFTLVEVIVVVLIVGVLAAVGLPTYQNYIERSHVALALAEVTHVKKAIEENLAQGLTDAEAQSLTGNTEEILKALGLSSASTLRCSNFDVRISSAGAASVICTIKGSAVIDGLKIQWLREASAEFGAPSSWACKTSVSEKFAPKYCEPNTTIS